LAANLQLGFPLRGSCHLPLEAVTDEVTDAKHPPDLSRVVSLKRTNLVFYIRTNTFEILADVQIGIPHNGNTQII
jgi:hypothetical protein